LITDWVGAHGSLLRQAPPMRTPRQGATTVCASWVDGERCVQLMSLLHAPDDASSPPGQRHAHFGIPDSRHSLVRRVENVCHAGASTRQGHGRPHPVTGSTTGGAVCRFAELAPVTVSGVAAVPPPSMPPPSLPPPPQAPSSTVRIKGRAMRCAGLNVRI
jgi:hypothetical protein